MTRIAGRHWGPISLEQLRAAGLSYGEIKGLIKRGYFHRRHRGVLIVGHQRLPGDGYLFAALLAFRDDAFLSHRTAAAVRGLRALAVKRIELTLPGGGVRRRAGLILHRTASPPHPDEVSVVRGLRVSSVPRLLLELAPRETPAELSRLITLAARKRVLPLDKMEEMLGRHSRRPGIAKLKLAYAGYRPMPDRASQLERAFDVRLQRETDLPEPLRNVTFEEGWEADYYWPVEKLVLELDGRPYHLSVADIERDRFRDAKLLAIGIRTLRITDRRFEHDAEGAVGDLRVLLGLPRARLAA